MSTQSGRTVKSGCGARKNDGGGGSAIKLNYFGSREVSRLAIVTLFIFKFSGVFSIRRYSSGVEIVFYYYYFFFVSYWFHQAITGKSFFIIIFILIIGLKEKKSRDVFATVYYVYIILRIYISPATTPFSYTYI